jgi:1,4-dihydroxy-2-naphthoate octaprenyltransferase
MTTFFDALTVACFIGLVVAFFQFTERDTPTLLRALLCGFALAVANQLGNMGYGVLGITLTFAAVCFGWLSFRRPRGDP